MTYKITDTPSGYAVVSPDGRLAEFLGSDEAEEAASRLRRGDDDESDYDWK